ncbi:hypothetical protein [Litorimonas sp. WD9-15]|uniref:hypothetical protein n=1 Tax=Litorimonas sp. WD9-15 TaxID=3418716 RepID=UPI003D013465
MPRTPSTKIENALISRDNHELAKRRKTQVTLGVVAGAAILGAVGFALATRSNRDTVVRYVSRLGGLLPGQDAPSSTMRARLTDVSENLRDILNR